MEQSSKRVGSQTQIVATIGPACGNVDVISKMIESGMDVARINFSHSTREINGEYIKNIREAARATGRRIPIIQDLSGPRAKTEEGHAFDMNEQSIITKKDLADLDFGIKEKVDYVAQSFVGRAEDVLVLRRAIEERGASIPIIAKIERKLAIENFDEILKATDAIMIARGDLGSEVPLENIPFIERDLIGKSRAAKKPVIVATQMMYSMKDNIEPTRAEVTDVAYAILMSADAVMLSDETAAGKYPVEVVAMMEKIVSRAEHSMRNGQINVL